MLYNNANLVNQLSRKIEQLERWAMEQGFEYEYEECYACNGTGTRVYLQYHGQAYENICDVCEGDKRQLKW